MKKNFILSLFVALLLGSAFNSMAQTQFAPAMFTPNPGPVNFVDLSVEPGATNLGTGDDVLKPVTLPFPFSIYGQVPTTNFDLSTNGWIGDIANTSSDLSNSCPYPDPNGAFPRLAFFHDDLDMEANSPSAIWVKSFPANEPGHPGHPIAGGTCIGAYVIHFKNAQNFPGLVNPPPTEMFNIEVILYENGSVALLYATDIVNANPSATVAIQGIGNPAVTLPGCNTAGMIQSQVYYLEALDGTESCGGGGGAGGACNATNCVTITCPADVTVTCFEDLEIDAEDAIASSTCGSITTAYVTQPHITGAPNCPGTTYVVSYRALDSEGNKGCCDRIITIANNPPVVTVPAGGTVSCYDEIEVSNDDATVTTACGEAYELKILPPVLNGVHECPGTTYTYGYRVRDNCGREVIANRVFTIGSNPAPTIVAPPDMTVSCNYFANLNPAYAEVTTGCTLGYTTTVTGPTTTGTANCPGATYTYTYTVTDECGRTASDTRKFTIANTAPVFLTCPSVPLIINCEDDGWQQIVQAWLASVQASSSCGTALNVTNNYNPNTQGLCINNGTRTVRWMATDNCGRTSICEQMLIVADTEPPVFVTAPQNELVVCNYITQDKLDAWVDAHGNAVVDDCWANVTWTTTPNNPTINCGGNPGPTSLTVTFIATDGCGNKSSMDATFTALPAIGIGGSSEEDLTEESLQLFQNQPNPFNDQTTISFYLPEATKAILSIYDVSGKLLKEIKGDYSEGMNMEEINRSDLQGAGMLYYKLSTEKETAIQRMILLD